MLDNKEILQKADLALADISSAGKLNPDQSKEFIRILIEQAVVMGMADVRPMKSHTEQLNKIKFGSRILHAGTEATALDEASRSKPSFTKVDLVAQLFKAEVRASAEVLEDSIEQGTLKQTIMELMAERIAVDMDEIIVNADTTSTDPDLAKFDGLLKAATSNVYNHGTNPASRSLWKNMLKTMPTPFLRNKKALRFLTSVDAETDYRDTVADRATVLGDKFVETDAPATYSSVPIVGVPLFPDNLGGGNNCTNAVLTDPSNMVVGIWREITVESEKLISEGVFKIVATIRWDFKYAHEPAVVKATNVKTQ